MLGCVLGAKGKAVNTQTKIIALTKLPFWGTQTIKRNK